MSSDAHQDLRDRFAGIHSACRRQAAVLELVADRLRAERERRGGRYPDDIEMLLDEAAEDVLDAALAARESIEQLDNVVLAARTLCAKLTPDVSTETTTS